MATKKQVMAAAEKHGIALFDQSNSLYWDVTLDAPKGMRMLASDAHYSCISWYAQPGEKESFWDAVLDDIESGTCKCDDQDCEQCNEV